MVRSTSRILTLFAFVLLSSALVASADPVIPIFNTSDGTTAGTLTVIRTNSISPGWDEIDLNFASWTATYPWGGADVRWRDDRHVERGRRQPGRFVAGRDRLGAANHQCQQQHPPRVVRELREHISF